MFSRQACSTDQPLSKATLLALLPSVVDTDNVIEVSTGKTISVQGQPQPLINSNVKSGVWEVIELQSPRKLLLNSSNWSIVSFSPHTGSVCVRFMDGVGTRTISLQIQRKNQ
jgi:hypothetical protein